MHKQQHGGAKQQRKPTQTRLKPIKPLPLSLSPLLPTSLGLSRGGVLTHDSRQFAAAAAVKGKKAIPQVESTKTTKKTTTKASAKVVRPVVLDVAPVKIAKGSKKNLELPPAAATTLTPTKTTKLSSKAPAPKLLLPNDGKKKKVSKIAPAVVVGSNKATKGAVFDSVTTPTPLKKLTAAQIKVESLAAQAKVLKTTTASSKKKKERGAKVAAEPTTTTKKLTKKEQTALDKPNKASSDAIATPAVKKSTKSLISPATVLKVKKALIEALPKKTKRSAAAAVVEEEVNAVDGGEESVEDNVPSPKGTKATAAAGKKAAKETTLIAKTALKLAKVKSVVKKLDPKLETKTAAIDSSTTPAKVTKKKGTAANKTTQNKITAMEEEQEQPSSPDETTNTTHSPPTRTKQTKSTKHQSKPTKTLTNSTTTAADDLVPATPQQPHTQPLQSQDGQLDAVLAPFLKRSTACRPTPWGTTALSFNQLIQRFSPTIKPQSVDGPQTTGARNHTPIAITSSDDLPPAEAQVFEPFLRRLAEIQSYHEWEAIEGLKRHVRTRFVAHLRATLLDPTELAKRTHDVDNLELELYMNKLTAEGIIKAVLPPVDASGAVHNSDGHGHLVQEQSSGTSNGDEHFAPGSSPTVPITTPHNNPNALNLGEDSRDTSTDDTNRRLHLRRGSSMTLPTAQVSSTHTSLPPRLHPLIPPQLLVIPKDPAVAKQNYAKQMHILRANYVSLHDMKYKEEVIYSALEDLNLIPPGYAYEAVKKTKLVLDKIKVESEGDESDPAPTSTTTHSDTEQYIYSFTSSHSDPATPTTTTTTTPSTKTHKKTTSQRELFTTTTPSTGSTDALLASLLSTLTECGFFTQEAGRFDIPLRDYTNLRTPYSIASWEIPAVPVLNYTRSPSADDSISPHIRLFDHYLSTITWDKLAVLQRLMLQDYRIELVRRFDQTVAQHQLVRFFLLSESYLQPRFFPAIKRLISDCYVHNLIDLKYTPRAHLDNSFMDRLTATQTTRPKVLSRFLPKLYTSISDLTTDLVPATGSDEKSTREDYYGSADEGKDGQITPHKLKRGVSPHTVVPLAVLESANVHYSKAHLNYLMHNGDTTADAQTDEEKKGSVVATTGKKNKPTTTTNTTTTLSADMGLPTDPLGIYPFGSVQPIPRKTLLAHLAQVEQKRYKNDVLRSFSQFYQQLLSSQVILDNAPPGSGHTGFTWVLKHLLDSEVISRQRWNPQQQQQQHTGIKQLDNGDNVTMRDLSLALGARFTSLPTEDDIISGAETVVDVGQETQTQNNTTKDSDVVQVFSDFAPVVNRKLRKLTTPAFTSTTTTAVQTQQQQNQQQRAASRRFVTFAPSPQPPNDPAFNPNNAYPLPLALDPMNPAHTKEALIVEGLQRMGVIGFNAGRYCYDIFLPLSTTPLTTTHIITPNQIRTGRSLLNNQQPQPPASPNSDSNEGDTAPAAIAPVQRQTMTISEALAHKQPKGPSRKSLQPIVSPVERIYAALVQSGIFAIPPPHVELPVGGEAGMGKKH